MKSKRIEKAFVNKFGHEFKPGDKCISVTVSTGRTNIARATYVGVIPTKHWDHKTRNYIDAYRVQVKRPHTQFCSIYTDTSEIAHWPYDSNRPRDYTHVTIEKITTLWDNNILPDTATVDEVASVV